MSRIQKILPQLAKANAQIYAVAVDSQKDLRALRARLKLTFPLLSDPKLSATRAYGVEQKGSEIALPASFVISSSGTISWLYVGKNPRDRPLEPKILKLIQTLSKEKPKASPQQKGSP